MSIELLDEREVRVFKKVIDMSNRASNDSLYNAAVFGSRARRDHKEDSDLDICLIFDLPDKELWHMTKDFMGELVNLQCEENLEINTYSIQKTRFINRDVSVIRNIVKEGLFWKDLK
jgi:predicted nucleotidyltransferase